MDFRLIEISPGVVTTRLENTLRTPETESPTRNALRTLVLSKIGFYISIFELLYIRSLESGDIAVGRNIDNDKTLGDSWEEEFTAERVDEALDRFEAVRQKEQIGADFA